MSQLTPQFVPFETPVQMTYPILTSSQYQRVKDLLDSREKIMGIKELRGITSWGLKETKDFCDYWQENPAEVEGQLLAKIDSRKPRHVKYDPTKEDYVELLTDIAYEFHEDTASLEILKSDLSACPERLLRWITLKVAKNQ